MSIFLQEMSRQKYIEMDQLNFLSKKKKETFGKKILERNFKRVKRGLYWNELLPFDSLLFSNKFFHGSFVTGLTALHFHGISVNNLSYVYSFANRSFKEERYMNHTFKNYKVQSNILGFGVYFNRSHLGGTITIANKERAILDFFYMDSFLNKQPDVHDFFLYGIDMYELNKIKKNYPKIVQTKLEKLLDENKSYI